MRFEEFVDEQVFSPVLIANALRTTKSEIAGTLGLGKDAFTRKSRIRARKTQVRLRQMLEILNRVEADNRVHACGIRLVSRRALVRFRRRHGGLPGAAGQGAITSMPIWIRSWRAVTPEFAVDPCASRDWFIGRTIRNGPGTLCRERAQGLHGGRFNRRGVPTLYTSLAPLTAVREATLLGRPMQPITLCAYEVDVEPVFDALDEALCRSLGVSGPDIECPSWRAEMLAGAVSASQALADRLIAKTATPECASGASRPPPAPDDVNLVLWTWGSERPSRLVLIDEERRLPQGLAHE